MSLTLFVYDMSIAVLVLGVLVAGICQSQQPIEYICLAFVLACVKTLGAGFIISGRYRQTGCATFLLGSAYLDIVGCTGFLLIGAIGVTAVSARSPTGTVDAINFFSVSTSFALSTLRLLFRN